MIILLHELRDAIYLYNGFWSRKIREIWLKHTYCINEEAVRRFTSTSWVTPLVHAPSYFATKIYTNKIAR